MPFKHTPEQEGSSFNPFPVNVPILYILKTPENLWLALFSGVMKWEHWPEMG